MISATEPLSEMAVIILPVQQHGQCDKHLMFCGGRCSREERQTMGHSLFSAQRKSEPGTIKSLVVRLPLVIHVSFNQNSALKASDKLSAYSTFE